MRNFKEKSYLKNKTKLRIFSSVMIGMFLIINTETVFAATPKHNNLKGSYEQQRYETSSNIALLSENSNIEHQSSNKSGTSTTKNELDLQNNFKIDDNSKMDNVAVPTVIKTNDGNVQINMNMTKTEKEMTVVEERPALKEKVGVSGVVGNPITIYSPVKSVNADVVISYADKDIKGIDEKNIRLFYYNSDIDKLELVTNQNVDTKNKVVNAKVTHFSTYVLADISVWEQYLSKNSIKPETKNPDKVSEKLNKSEDITGKNSDIDTNKDSDGDGIPDWIEKLGYYFEGLNGKYIPPTNPESKDTDGDGYTDAQELGDFYYDEQSHKVFISRDNKYSNGPDKKPYQSNPNSLQETPESWLKPSNKYNSKLARVLAYSSEYAYSDKVDEATVLKNNNFKGLNTIYKFKMNWSNGTVEDMEALLGYKELTDGRKAILISFRGSMEKTDWITDVFCAVSKPQDPYENEKNVRLHAGFSDYSNVFINEMKNVTLADMNLQELINDNANGIRNDIFLITGHSLGGGAAEVFAGHLKNEGIKNINCYTFAAPPIAFSGEEYFDDINIKRIYNKMDPVVNMPGSIPINTGSMFKPNYEYLKHVNTGIELPLSYEDKELQQINKTIEEYNKKGLWDKVTGLKDYLYSRVKDKYIQFHSMSNIYLEYLDRIND